MCGPYLSTNFSANDYIAVILSTECLLIGFTPYPSTYYLYHYSTISSKNRSKHFAHFFHSNTTHITNTSSIASTNPTSDRQVYVTFIAAGHFLAHTQ